MELSASGWLTELCVSLAIPCQGSNVLTWFIVLFQFYSIVCISWTFQIPVGDDIYHYIATQVLIRMYFLQTDKESALASYIDHMIVAANLLIS